MGTWGLFPSPPAPTRLADARKREGEALYFPSDSRFASNR
jgi:hypothetical protein